MNLYLEQLAQSVTTASDLESLTRPLLALLQEMTGLDSTYLTKVDQAAGYQQILYAMNTASLILPEGLKVPWGDTLCRRAILQQRFVTQDVPAIWGDSDAARELGLQTYVSVPVYLSDGELFGTLCGASAVQTEVEDKHSKILQLFAQLIAWQLERERQLLQQSKRAQEAEHRLHGMSLLAELGDLCLLASSLNEVLKKATVLLQQLPEWPLVLPFRQHTGQPELLATPKLTMEQHDAVYYLIRCYSQKAVQQKQLLWLCDGSNEAINAMRDILGLKPIGPVACITAESHEELEGGILLLSNQDELPESTLLHSCSYYLSLLATRLYDQSCLEQMNKELSVHALHDPLTSLANRRYLHESLQRTMAQKKRHGGQLLLAFIDLDKFKRINDDYGHQVGDAFLLALAKRLQAVMREGDLVARYGGDEFIVMACLAADDDVELATSRLHAKLMETTSGTLIYRE
ncbi:sensor domain-containing diguanylate cyclase [Alkalimonas sp.]|uniref:sensor domain-containing diguanylate cyclase n=1 Tax=Alkalimonas sp. TaxID=1872453 RepID=UPI00260304F6|nr:sensor domain-containing diguanylate cyclase [Alkalimonas sp.]MCC5825423.1 sensor domain-containing diguanylate cyclase [Alkalimonas sp.]